MKLTNKSKVEIFIPYGTKSRLRHAAKEQGLTMAGLIKVILNAYLNKSWP